MVVWLGGQAEWPIIVCDIFIAHILLLRVWRGRLSLYFTFLTNIRYYRVTSVDQWWHLQVDLITLDAQILILSS